MLIRSVTVADDLSPLGADRPWTRVAVDGGELLGVAHREPSAWHPKWDWAEVLVLPQHRRAGVGSDLMRELGAPCKSKVPVGSEGAAFLRALNWRLLQGCEIHELPTTALEERARPLPPQAVTAAWFAFYERAHRWDPLAADRSAEELAASISDADAAFLVGPPTDPLAVACLWAKDGAWEFSGGPCRDGGTVTELLDLASAFADGLPLHLEVDSDMNEIHEELRRRGSTVIEAIEIYGTSALA